MKKKVIILILIIILSILFVAWRNQDNDYDGSKEIVEEESIGVEEEPVRVEEESIDSPNSIEFCRNLEIDYLMDALVSDQFICYINYGKLNGSDNCNEEEIELCNIGVAVKNNNISYCNVIEDYSFFCFLGFGIGFGDINICDQIEETEMKEICSIGVDIYNYRNAIINENITFCDSIIESISKHDEGVNTNTCGNGVCEEYELLSTCYDDCKDLEKHTYKLCQKAWPNNVINVNLFGTDITLDMGAILGPDFNLEPTCGREGPTMVQCNYCNSLEEVHMPLYELEFKSDMFVCESIRNFSIDDIEYVGGNCSAIKSNAAYFPYDESKSWHPTKVIIEPENYGKVRLKDKCFYDLSMKTKDITLCENIDIQEIKSKCYYEFALEQSNLDICNKADLLKYECIIKIAMQQENVDLCYKSEGALNYYCVAECVKQIAVSKQDEILCDLLREGFGKVKKECYSAVDFERRGETFDNNSMGWDCIYMMDKFFD